MLRAILSSRKSDPSCRGMRAPVQTSYESKDVAIPADFLCTQPEDAKPITLTPVDWDSKLPEYGDCYAVVLDHVLSPTECSTLTQLAESSVLDKDKGPNQDPWTPALVNVGGGYEVLEAKYRNSDRIIWDSQDIVDRIWTRLETVPGVTEKLLAFNESDLGGGPKRSRKPGADWKFHRVNKRLRFLRYGGGQFFRPHCDGPYGTVEDGKVLRTHFTVHLYLNDCKKEKPEAELVGGATSFLSSDETRKLDVDPKAGRMLIFQHRRLYHSGDDVVKGTKYTVRTDIMYELQEREAPTS